MKISPNESGGFFELIKGFFRFVRMILAFIGGCFVMLFFALIFSAAFFKAENKGPQFDAGVPFVLNMKLSGPVLDKALNAEENFMAEFTGEGFGIYLPKLSADLQRYSEMEDLKGIFVNIDGLSGSYANFDEIRQLFSKFKESGKLIYFWFSSGTHFDYYLASVGDKIYMPPVSSLMMLGPTFSLTYYGEALKKIGVGIDVIRHGKYKSAFESFVQNKPSEATMEMYLSMEESMRLQLAEKIANGRKLTQSPIETVNSWFKKSIFSIAELEKMGLVDGLKYEDDALADLKEKAAVEKVYKFKSFGGYEPDFSIQSDSIALIEAIGTIEGSNNPTDSITYLNLSRKLKWAMEDDSIRAVVFRISSPGGSAITSDLIWNEVKKLAEKKPVVVSMGTYAASGGYYIAAPATKIFAQPNTITGSIGVISMVPNLMAFEEKYGVTFNAVSTSDRKNLFSIGDSPTEEDKQILANHTDEVYLDFINRVAEGRKMPVSDVDAIGQGRVWTGSQAKKIGLVDELGGLNESIQEAKKLAKLDVNQKYPLRRYFPKGGSFFDCIKETSDAADCFSAANGSVLSRVKSLFMSKEEIKIQEVTKFIETLKVEPVQTVMEGYYNF